MGPDLVILDIGLPDANGIELIGPIHDLSPETDIIMLTSGGRAGDTERREALAIEVAKSIPGERVVRVLERLAFTRGKPRVIVMDNGPEFTCKAMFFWAREQHVKLHFIQPGKPTQNAFVESFNGKFREYCLNLHWFRSLRHGRGRRPPSGANRGAEPGAEHPAYRPAAGHTVHGARGGRL